MFFIEKLISLVSKKEYINSSNLTTISTRFGLFKVKAYKSGNSEYLVIMSRNFYELKDPIVYIHSNFHIHSDPDSNIRYLHNEINSVLKMMRKVGGLIIYPSSNGESIDGLLGEINAKKLESGKNVMKKEKIDLGFKIEDRGYLPLCLILKSLNLSSIKLVSSDIKLAALTERLGINIIKRVPAISFEYGR